MNNLAGAGSRFVAFFVDTLVGIALLLLPLLKMSDSSSWSTLMDGVVFTIFYYLMFVSLIFPFVNSVMISTFGGTLGKLLTGIRIVRPNGQKLTFWRAFFRHQIGYMISGCFLWLGFIWILIDKEKRSWHDQIADTYVVTVQKMMVIFGLVVLALMVYVNTLLVIQTADNFAKHQSLYQTIGEDIAAELDKTLKEEEVRQD